MAYPKIKYLLIFITLFSVATFANSDLALDQAYCMGTWGGSGRAAVCSTIINAALNPDAMPCRNHFGAKHDWRPTTKTKIQELKCKSAAMSVVCYGGFFAEKVTPENGAGKSKSWVCSYSEQAPKEPLL